MKAKLVILIAVIFSMLLIACRSADIDNNKKEDRAKNVDISVSADDAKDIVVITAGGREVYLDEARYYMYNTQATYEAVYMAKDKKVDWEQIVEGDVVLKDAAKSSVIDKICKREAILCYADKYDISLSEEEKERIKKKVQTFFYESNDKLLKRIDINSERLTEVYTKDLYYENIVHKMEAEEEGKSDKVYAQWKKENSVDVSPYWDAMNFDTPIMY